MTAFRARGLARPGLRRRFTPASRAGPPRSTLQAGMLRPADAARPDRSRIVTTSPTATPYLTTRVKIERSPIGCAWSGFSITAENMAW